MFGTIQSCVILSSTIDYSASPVDLSPSCSNGCLVHHYYLNLIHFLLSSPILCTNKATLPKGKPTNLGNRVSGVPSTSRHVVPRRLRPPKYSPVLILIRSRNPALDPRFIRLVFTPLSAGYLVFTLSHLNPHLPVFATIFPTGFHLLSPPQKHVLSRSDMLQSRFVMQTFLFAYILSHRRCTEIPKDSIIFLISRAERSM